MNDAQLDMAPPIELFDNDICLWPAEKALVMEFFPPAPARILDIGCGNGRTTIPLSRSGYDMVGLDISEEIVRRARVHCPDIHFVTGDAEHLDFPGGSFDAVLFSWNGLDCIQTVAGRRRALNEILRVTKPGGRFLFSSHNALGIWGRLIRPPGLTMQALRFLCDQISVRRLRSGWYSAWRDSSAGREIYYYYSAPPGINVRELADAGWRVLAVRGDSRPLESAKVFKDVHIHYVCERPEADHA